MNTVYGIFAARNFAILLSSLEGLNLNFKKARTVNHKLTIKSTKNFLGQTVRNKHNYL